MDLILFNMFRNYLDDGVESTFTKFADNTEMDGEVDTSERRAILQCDLDRLEQWTSKNSMKFNKDKSCTWEDIMKELSAGLGLCGRAASSLVDLGVLVGNKLNMSQQSSATATMVNWILGCIPRGITSGDGYVIIPLGAGQAAPGVLCPVLVPTIQERHRQTGEGLKEGCKDD